MAFLESRTWEMPACVNFHTASQSVRLACDRGSEAIVVNHRMSDQKFTILNSSVLRKAR
jgi:hypothetical protein